MQLSGRFVPSSGVCQSFAHARGAVPTHDVDPRRASVSCGFLLDDVLGCGDLVGRQRRSDRAEPEDRSDDETTFPVLDRYLAIEMSYAWPVAVQALVVHFRGHGE